MFAVILNGITATAGACIGVVLKRAIPQKQGTALMAVIAICTLIMGLQSALKTENLLLLLASMVLGTLIGTALGIDDAMHRFGRYVCDHLAGAAGNTSFLYVFVNLSILQVVGAMSIMGPIQSALVGDNSILYFKSILDFLSALIFASAYGKGAIPVGIVVASVEMVFFLLAQIISPLVTADVIRELNAAGGVILLGLALNMLKLQELKICDFLPALIIPAIYYNLLV